MRMEPSIRETPYLEFAKSVTPGWRQQDVLRRLQAPLMSELRVVDISSTGEVHDCWWAKYKTRLEEERQALRDERGDVKTRLVLFTGGSTSLRDVCELYGVEFQIEPSFFLACAHGGQKFGRPLLFLDEDPPTFLNLGRGICVKIVDKQFNHPFIQNGGTIILMCLPQFHDVYEVLISIIPWEISMDLSFKTFLRRFQLSPTEHSVQLLSLVELYVEMISRFPTDEMLDANEVPLKFLVPLLKVLVNQFQAIAAYHYHTFTERRSDANEASGFVSLWRPLRDEMMAASLMFEAFKQYDMCHAHGVVQQTTKLQDLSRRFHYLQGRISHLEQHIRDELQLQVGNSSLQESRESIKQSKMAREESKSVKMLTILAFVFIPLSLATSIFGMNIQELNSTGQPVWVFAVAASSILLSALCIWATVYQWTKYIHAPACENYLREESPEITVWDRGKAAFWLLSHGHILWCWRSGILFSLFTKGRKGFAVTCTGRFETSGCLMPKERDIRQLKDGHAKGTCDFFKRPEGPQDGLFLFRTHHPHYPVSYVFAHSVPEGNGNTAFSFAKAN